MVFAYHAWEFAKSPRLVLPFVHFDLARIVDHLSRGVDLFMVLSGFCLFLPLCKSAESMAKFDTRQFFRRRLRRIVPPYYASLVYVTLVPMALVALFHLMHKPAKWQPLPGPFDVFAHLTFIHSLFPKFWASWSSVAWSLGVEAHFYLFFPIAVIGFRRFGLPFVWFGCAVSSLFLAAACQLTLHARSDVQMVAHLFWVGRWTEFGAGMVTAWYVAEFRRSGRTLTRGAGVPMCMAGILLFLAGACAPTSDAINVAILSVAGALLVISLSAGGLRLNWSFEHPAMVWVGTRSYSVYLLHFTTIYFLARLLRTQVHWSGLHVLGLEMTFGLVAVLFVSDLSYRWFERPFLQAGTPKAGSAGRRGGQAPATAHGHSA
jgi:peptidoglycan/LPS O-acetylase OafA/YrhL